jgi:hypothetical protein
MNDIFIDIIIFKIYTFLDFTTKMNFSIINKYLYLLKNKYLLNIDIGNIIYSKLGFNYKNKRDNDDLCFHFKNIKDKYSLINGIVKIINDFYFCKETKKYLKIYYSKNLTPGYIMRLDRKTINECKKLLLQKNYNCKYIKRNLLQYKFKIMRKKFPLTYSLLLI